MTRKLIAPTNLHILCQTEQAKGEEETGKQENEKKRKWK
jgi:hypothetical protein